MHIIAAVNVGDSLQQAFDSFFGFLPNLLGFLVILVIGYIVARIVKGILTKVLAKVGLDKLGNNGVVYQGLETLGSGSVLAGMVLGAMAAFIIERQLNRAAVTAFIGAGLAWIGLIHGAKLGWMVAPGVALGYALFGVVCLVAALQHKQAPS